MTAFCVPAGYHPATGNRRDGTGAALVDAGTRGWHWLSTASRSIDFEALCLRFAATDVFGGSTDDYYRSGAFSVRCLQAFTLAYDLFEVAEQGERSRDFSGSASRF